MPTERDFESVVERQIREAAERGEFDDLPGSGRPLEDLEPVHDPAWWAKRFIKRERARDAADEVRRAIRAELPRLRVAPDRDAAAKRIEELNAIVEAANEHLAEADRVLSVEL